MDATSIVNIATPVVVPLIIAGFKWVIPKVPTWVLPILAPILGLLMGAISNLALQEHGNILIAAALGLAGVGVREIIDQLKPEPSKDPKD